MTFPSVTLISSRNSITKRFNLFQSRLAGWYMKPSLLFISCCMVLFLITPCWSQNFKPVRVGDPFKPFTLKSNLSKKDRKALKLPEQETISLKDFKAEIMIIEMLNVHCHTCQLQMPVFNQLAEAIQSDDFLKSKVAMLGITVGNNAEEIAAFQTDFQPRYPILPDPLKEVYNNLSDPKGTPQTYIIRRDSGENWFILYHHRGAVDSHEMYLQKIREFFKTSLEGIEPGYRIPRALLQELQKKYPAQSFAAKQMLLYFPSAVTFPLETDSRNRKNQMPVLLSLLGNDKLALVIAGELKRLFPSQELDALASTPGVFLLEDEGAALTKLFKVADNPLICLANDSGGIVYRAGSLTSAQAAEVLEGTIPALKPTLKEEDLMALMQESMKEINPDLGWVEKKELAGGAAVYVGFTPLSARADEGVLFGRVVSKYSICDVCHDIHFYFIFDGSGQLISFKPIKLTKYGNVDFNQEDIDKLQGRLGGKDLFKAIPFDPAVDAISRATMSTYLIFEGINDTRTTLNDFKGNGFRKEVWKEECHAHLCQLQEAIRLFKQSGASGTLTLEDQTSLNTALIKPYLLSPKTATCPTGGKYLLIGESPLCSSHGMNLQPCPGDAGEAPAGQL